VRLRFRGGSPAVLARDYADDDGMAGGFVRDDAPGGFLPVDSGGGGGGFLPSDSGGGFLPEDDAGGFIPAGSGGGFISEGSGGGFLPDDTSGGFVGGGGFIPDDDSASEDASIASAPAPSASALPLSRVPGALVRLGLPPDDPDVLRVLANAAAGWGADADPGAEREKAVLRRDWRAVCAVLMDGADPGMDEGEGDESGESDAYVGSDADADEGEAMDVDASGDEDEYGPRVRRTRTKGKGKARADDSDDDTDDGALSAHQAAEVRRAFGLFFAAAGDDPDGADGRRLGVREIDAAARVLKEQITAEDVRVHVCAWRGRLTMCRSWRCSMCSRRARTRRWACPSLSG
jgi:hypothetical protein